MLRFKSLGSGSSGNATLVEVMQNGQTTRLLVDCGLKLRELEARLQEAGAPAQTLNAIFITHEHGDHIGCARSFVKRHATSLWMSQGTWQAVADETWQMAVQFAKDSVVFQVGDLHITPFTVPHDAREPLQLRCSDGQRHLGLVTDLGHVSPHVVHSLQGVHALLLETNHDPALLQRSAYPEFLKRRVGGPLGHLANAAAADLLARVHHPELRRVVAAHLSERNNTSELVRLALGTLAPNETTALEIASPQRGTEWFEV